jgi:tetratricopeptide (TPR) repeat protein
MPDEEIMSRYEMLGSGVEDKFGRHIPAKRKEDGKDCTITILDPQLKVVPEQVIKVVRASERLSELLSRSILLCIEAGETGGGNFYLVYEASPYTDLKALIKKKGGLSPEETITIAYRIGAALRLASSVGENHLDLTSSCIFVDPDALNVRIGRFGFCHLLPPYSQAQKTRPYHGSPEYMAPEVCSGKAGDAVSDLYALGILIYEMIAGKTPFMSSSASTTLKRQVYEKPLPLHLVKPTLQGVDALEKVVSKLLAKDPKTRPADGTEVMEMLAQLQKVFPKAVYELELEREEPVKIVCNVVVPEEPEAKAREVEASPKETLVFTGLSELVAQEVEAKAQAQQAKVEVSRPTEAFDTEALEEALKKTKEAVETEEEVQAKEKRIEGEGKEEEGEVKEGIKEEMKEKVAKEKASEGKPEEKKGDDWFVDGTKPFTVLPDDGEIEEKKESRMFWVIVGVLGILIVVGGLLYFGRPQPPPPPRPATEIVKELPKEPEPQLTPEQMKAQRIKELLEQGLQAIADENPELAMEKAQRVLAEDPENSRAKELLKTANEVIEAKKAVEQKKVEEAKKEEQKTEEVKPVEPPKKPQKVVGVPVEKPEKPKKPVPERAPKPQVKPAEAKQPAKIAPPAMSDEEKEAKIHALLVEGRDKFKSGDYEGSIRVFNKVLELQPDNKIARTLIEQAKVKLGQ